MTGPHPAGEPLPPQLREIPDGEPGAGDRLLPVQRTDTPVDLDLVNTAMRRPYAERLTIILNELGTAVAGRGRELNEIIRRANPALRETSEVLALLGRQNRVLADLARDSDTVLAPLARDRERVGSFVANAGDVAQATAERRSDLEADIRRLPAALREIRPTMTQLSGFGGLATPVLADLRPIAPDLSRFLAELGPFAQAATPALETLGDAARRGTPAVRDARPIVARLRTLSGELRPVGSTLAAILESFQRNEGIERLADYLFFQVAAINGFDSLGHYLRANLIVNSCSSYTTIQVSGCEARFETDEPAATASAANSDPVLARTARVLRREGIGRAERRGAQAQPADRRDRPARGARREDERERARDAARLPARGRSAMTPAASAIAGNPVLIGAATVLVVIIAVFLSYNANSGLPFVPTYELSARLPSGANLVVGNEVRIGGARVGVIRAIEPERRPDGSVHALVAMKLERSVKPLPRDSTVLVRPRSALGLKYVEITRGRSPDGYEDGDTIPLSAARPAPVEFDEVVNTFDERTRDGAQRSLQGFGDALAGRGDDVNLALGELRRCCSSSSSRSRAT